MIKKNPTVIDNDIEKLHEWIVESILDIKGENIVKLDLRKLDDAPTNFFIICEGTNSTQVTAIAQNIKKKVKLECGIHPSFIEGSKNGNWVIVDYFNTVVHVFYKDTRSFYSLESLWGDAVIEEIALDKSDRKVQ